MASEPVARPSAPEYTIDDGLRKLLHLTETETHYVTRTLSGATLMWPKAEIQYPWQMLRGIMDDGKDTSEERRREREWELADDERKLSGRGRVAE